MVTVRPLFPARIAVLRSTHVGRTEPATEEGRSDAEGSERRGVRSRSERSEQSQSIEQLRRRTQGTDRTNRSHNILDFILNKCRL